MKIAHIGLMVNGRSEGLSKAFRKVAAQYVEFKVSAHLPRQLSNLPFMPDLIFLQIQDDFIRDGRVANKTDEYLAFALRNLMQKGTFIINWTGDKRNGTPRWMVNLARNVSLTCFSNEEDVKNLKTLGLKSEFLQIGIDPETFKKYPPESGHDIVYMANHHSQFPFTGFRMQTVQFLNKEFGDKFAVYGNGYPRAKSAIIADGNNPFPEQSRESKIYNSSKIGISVSNFNSDRYTSDRMLRLMGSNCFCLSYHYLGVEKDFEIGKQIDTFKSFPELKEKINFYLQNEDKRNQIRDEGFKLVHEKHTYDNMVQDIINLMK